LEVIVNVGEQIHFEFHFKKFNEEGRLSGSVAKRLSHPGAPNLVIACGIKSTMGTKVNCHVINISLNQQQGYRMP